MSLIQTPKPLSLTFMLAPMICAIAITMDVYVPAIPHITQYFNASDNVVLLTLSLFMATAGIMQLIIGPLSDTHGRKPLLYAAIGLFSLSSMLCALSPSIAWLICFRVFQAVGCCGLVVLGFAIARDYYQGNALAKIYGYLYGFNAISPIIAPFIGSHIDINYGWQATFLMCLLLALINLITLYFFLPESLPVEKRQPSALKNNLQTYTKLLKHKTFMLYTLLTSFGLSYLYLFCALSPFLIIRDLHVQEQEYGFYFAFMGLSFLLGSSLTSLCVSRLGIQKTCLLGLILSLLGGIWMAMWYYIAGLQLHGFVYPMLLIGGGGTICLSAGNAGAMNQFGSHTGAAAALSGTIRYLFASLTGLIVINDHVACTLPLGLPAILFSLIGIAFFLNCNLIKG